MPIAQGVSAPPAGKIKTSSAAKPAAKNAKTAERAAALEGIGGLAQAGDVLLQPVRTELQRRLAWRPAPPVQATRFGSDAGMRGAALLAATAQKEGDQ